MQEVTEITTLIQDWLLPVAITLVALSALLLVKSLLLLRANRKAPHQGLQVFLKTLGLPLTLCILVVTLFLFSTLVHNFGLDSEGLQATNTNVARLLLIAALVLFVDRLTVVLLASYSTRSELLRNSHSVARGMVHILVFGIGLLVLLGTLGVSTPPHCGVPGGLPLLAVALALQPTLENFFSGLQLIFGKPIRVGDCIELDFGEQGFVEKIGRRSTWIRMLPNNLVIMLNSKLSDTKLIN